MKFSVLVAFWFFCFYLFLMLSLLQAMPAETMKEHWQGSLLGSSPSRAPSTQAVVLRLQQKKWIAGASDGFLQQASRYVSPPSRPAPVPWGKACRAGFAVPKCDSTLPEPRIPAASSFALDRSQLNVPGWLLGGSKQRWVGKRVSLENTGVTAGRQLRPGTLHGKGSWCWKHLAGYGQSCLHVSSFFNDTALADTCLVPSFLGRARQADPHSPLQMRGFAGRGRASRARLRTLWNVCLCLKGAEMFGYG